MLTHARFKGVIHTQLGSILEVSTIISIAAIIISLLTLIHTVVKSDRDNINLSLAKREEQLIILSEIKNDLNKFITQIKKKGIEKNLSDSNIDETVLFYKGMLNETQEHFEWLESNPKIDLKTLYSMSHRISSIQANISSWVTALDKDV